MNARAKLINAAAAAADQVPACTMYTRTYVIRILRVYYDGCRRVTNEKLRSYPIDTSDVGQNFNQGLRRFTYEREKKKINIYYTFKYAVLKVNIKSYGKIDKI